MRMKKQVAAHGSKEDEAAVAMVAAGDGKNDKAGSGGGRNSKMRWAAGNDKNKEAGGNGDGK